MTDEEVIDHTPVGYRWLIVYAAILKRVLANDPMTTGERLEMLEALNTMTGAWFTTEALALLAPADDTTLEIVRMAWRLDRDDATGSASFDVLTSEEVFSDLARLNPTIVAAIKVCTRGRDRAPAPQPSETPQAASAAAANAPPIGPRLERAAEPQRASGTDFDLF
jgi:hypothetical protein